MKRREFLKAAGALGAQSVLTGGLLNTLFLRNAQAQSVPLLSLKQSLNPEDAAVLTPADATFAQYQTSFNMRTMLTPQVRVLCRNEKSVANALAWAKENQIPLAMRNGGHSYEGFSQSTGMVIDCRFMNDITVDTNTVTVGSGSQLGNIYQSLSEHKLAIPAGSCPTVGATGHTTGGGYGLLARPLGLACDSLVELEMVDANGNILTVNESQNADLFWACRGAGNGQFGVITKLLYKTHQVPQVVVYGFGWTVNLKVAAKLMRTWQQWAPNAPSTITSLMTASKNHDGTLSLRCKGQSVGTEDELKKQIKPLLDIMHSENLVIKTIPFFEAVKRFAGGFDYPSEYMKAKSDYVNKVMNDEAMNAFLGKLPEGINVICDSYGGAISKVRREDTAFAHREGYICSVQYSTSWKDPKNMPAHMQLIRQYHDSLRPYMSGGAYVNYCDLDLKNFGTAYWGENFERLKTIKAKYDPENIFKHAQSIPVK